MIASTWFDALYQCQHQGKGYVLITVLSKAGSTPRDSGSKMLITDDSQFDTIGGGHLEFEAIDYARQLLIQGQSINKTVSYPLSSSLGQCCGGAVKVLYEVMLGHQQHIAVFGAGHVAQALVPLLAQLPLQITWVDSREQFFEHMPNTMQAQISSFSNVKQVINDDPCKSLSDLPQNAWVVILTHNHQLDYDLVEQALKHPKLDFVGMIGSMTKAKRFTTRLVHRGFSEQQIARLTSPIGDLSIPGKRPIEVAVSISAQLLRLMHQGISPEKTRSKQAKPEQDIPSVDKKREIT